MASVIVGIVLWRVYARKIVSLTKVTNILVKKYSSTVLGKEKKSSVKSSSNSASTKVIEKEEKEQEEERKSLPMIAIEGWLKKSGKSLLGTSYQKRFVLRTQIARHNVRLIPIFVSYLSNSMRSLTPVC